MIFDNFIENIKKAIKVWREDGLVELFRILRFKLSTISILTPGDVFKKIRRKRIRINRIDRYELVVFSGIPYDDIGGGQRSAQLTRAALRTGMHILYVYAYPKYDVNNRLNVASNVRITNLLHVNIRDYSVKKFLENIEGNTRIIFEIPHPLFLEYLETARIRGAHTVFELIDDWSTSLGGDWFVEDVFRRFVSLAEVVTGTSKLLTQKLIALGRVDATYLPNAANEYIFDNHRPYKRPVDLPRSPVALYFGSLYGEWFGWNYLREAAENTAHVNYCLIGNKPPQVPVRLPENVHFLGEKKIDELPSYLSAADFCLLPFIPNSLSDAVSPIKVFEYLFMEKPVVSTDLLEVKDYPRVFAAQDEIEFTRLCKQLDQEIDRVDISTNNIDAFIYQNSWFLRLQKVMGIKGRQEVSAIILMHNNRNIIGRCLQSLLENCASYLADVVVIDNASQDGGAEYVAENFPTVRLVKNSLNGCSSGRNLGVNNSVGKYLAFFDSDQWFTGCFCFEEATRILEAHADIGAVGWSAGWLDMSVEHLGAPIVDDFPGRAMDEDASIRGYRTDVAYLGSGGLFIPRTVFEATGGFDPTYDPTSFEDTDLSFAIKKLGFKIAYRDLSCIRHDAHRTTVATDNSPEYLELFTRNSKYFQEKWKNYRQYFLEL